MKRKRKRKTKSYCSHLRNASPGNQWESRPVRGFAVKDLGLTWYLLACAFRPKGLASSCQQQAAALQEVAALRGTLAAGAKSHAGRVRIRT